MNTEKMIELLRTLDNSVIDMIDALTTPQRKDLYLAAKASGVEVFPRNIYYNYATQEWVMPEASWIMPNADESSTDES